MAYTQTLLQRIEEERSPVMLKEHLLGLEQVLLNELISTKEDKEAWEEQRVALETLTRSVVRAVELKEFSRGDLQSVKELIFSVREAILKHGGIIDQLRGRWLDPNDKNLALWHEVIKQSRERIDTIVPIANGAIEPAALASLHFGTENILPVRYSTRKWAEASAKVPRNMPQEYIEEKIRGKSTLITEDCIEEGTAVKGVVKWVHNNGAGRVYVSTVAGYSKEKGSYSLEIGKEKLKDFGYQEVGAGLFLVVR